MSRQDTIDCFSHISTEERARYYSETRSRSNVSGAYTCWKTLIKLTFLTERLYRLTEGWHQNISLLPVPRTDSLNSLAEALRNTVCSKACGVHCAYFTSRNTVCSKACGVHCAYFTCRNTVCSKACGVLCAYFTSRNTVCSKACGVLCAYFTSRNCSVHISPAEIQYVLKHAVCTVHISPAEISMF